jgi:hypothetical protein
MYTASESGRRCHDRGGLSFLEVVHHKHDSHNDGDDDHGKDHQSEPGFSFSDSRALLPSVITRNVRDTGV